MSESNPQLQALRDALQELQAPDHHHAQAMQRFLQRRPSRITWRPVVSLAGAAGILLLLVFWPRTPESTVVPMNPGVSYLTASGHGAIPRLADLNSPSASVLVLPPRPRMSISLSLLTAKSTKKSEV